MELKSVWGDLEGKYSELNGDIETEILVVGGGITGRLTAHELAARGHKVVLIEGETLATGSSGIATAKVTAAQGLIYYDLLKRYGKNAAKAYYSAQCAGMASITGLIEKYNIDCELIKTDGALFSRSVSGYKKLIRGLKSCEAVFYTSKLKGVKEDIRALIMPSQYAFNPVKFVDGLPVNYDIYEHTPAIELDISARKVRTPKGSIRAEKIIIATRYPFTDEKGGYAMKLRPSMAFSIAVKERLTEELVLEDKEDGLSLRPYSGGTIICGCDCRTGRAGNIDRFEQLKKRVSELYGDGLTVQTAWCGEDCMTYDGMPLVGEWERGKSDILIATGFNKWGMANSAVAAGLLSDIVEGKENAFAGVFYPHRRIKKALGAMLINAIHNMCGVLAGLLPTIRSENSLKKGEAARVRTKQGVKCVYCDENGVKHYTYGKCPHKGCKLVWNDSAKTWDCPCHGNRELLR